ncbi:MAG: hypothetical protein Q8R82_22030 [Hyphomonadaceae bacterium]|nr:hypothetical protein [Hyphomonadaceae bacterium]
MMKIILATATFVALSAPAFAQVTTAPPAAKPAAEDKFTKHDANADGALSLAEVQVADSKVTQTDFDKYDADKSKSLSKVEFSKWAEAKMTPPASAPGR